MELFEVFRKLHDISEEGMQAIENESDDQLELVMAKFVVLMIQLDALQ